jgi:Skp family chaperone for outer membrane proteins
MAHLAPSIALACSLLALTACSSTMIEARESLFGYEKREQLVDRVEDARDAQQDAKEQFASALDEFLAVAGTPASDLEETYRDLKKQYERSESRADDVRSRINKVEQVADRLFDEWEDELDDYQSDSLRTTSASQLSETRQLYSQLLGAMRNAESRMDPVLAAFSDQVLFLKHNLNAQAIASLGATAGQLESDIAALIAEMEASIAEADAFIQSMQGDG